MSFISVISQFLYYRTIPEHEDIKKKTYAQNFRARTRIQE